VSRSELEHCAFEHVVFADGLCGLGSEAIENRRKVLGGCRLFVARRGLTLLIVTRFSITQVSGLLAMIFGAMIFLSMILLTMVSLTMILLIMVVERGGLLRLVGLGFSRGLLLG
jgi:hypothetical protein